MFSMCVVVPLLIVYDCYYCCCCVCVWLSLFLLFCQQVLSISFDCLYTTILFAHLSCFLQHKQKRSSISCCFTLFTRMYVRTVRRGCGGEMMINKKHLSSILHHHQQNMRHKRSCFYSFITCTFSSIFSRKLRLGFFLKRRYETIVVSSKRSLRCDSDDCWRCCCCVITM